MPQEGRVPEAVQRFVKLEYNALLDIASRHSHVDKSVYRSMYKGVCDVELPKH
jgi:hypothetical protein